MLSLMFMETISASKLPRKSIKNLSSRTLVEVVAMCLWWTMIRRIKSRTSSRRNKTGRKNRMRSTRKHTWRVRRTMKLMWSAWRRLSRNTMLVFSKTRKSPRRRKPKRKRTWRKRRRNRLTAKTLPMIGKRKRKRSTALRMQRARRIMSNTPHAWMRSTCSIGKRRWSVLTFLLKTSWRRKRNTRRL